MEHIKEKETTYKIVPDPEQPKFLEEIPSSILIFLCNRYILEEQYNIMERISRSELYEEYEKFCTDYIQSKYENPDFTYYIDKLDFNYWLEKLGGNLHKGKNKNGTGIWLWTNIQKHRTDYHKDGYFSEDMRFFTED